MRRREELVTAARRVIGRDGFAGATVGTITREAGASLGLLNYHFGSKDEVVAEAFAAAAREDLAELEAISRRFEDPAARLAAYLDQSEWEDTESWRLWVDAWGESVHSPLVRDTLGRFDIGWRAVLAEVLVEGVRQGCWECADPQDTAARLVAVLDGIGLHTTVHGEDVPPGRATAWARRLAELELGVPLPAPPPPFVAPIAARVHRDPAGDPRPRPRRPRPRRSGRALHLPGGGARDLARRARVADAIVTHVAVGYLRPLGRDPVNVTCTLDAVGRASFRTRETVETDEGLAVEAATTLEVPGRALTAAEREELRVRATRRRGVPTSPASDAEVGGDRRPDLLPRALDRHRRVVGQRADAVAVDQRQQAIDRAAGVGHLELAVATPSAIVSPNHSCMRA